MSLFGKKDKSVELKRVGTNQQLLNYLRNNGAGEKLGCDLSDLCYKELGMQGWARQVYSIRTTQKPDEELAQVEEIRLGEYKFRK